VSRGDSGRRPTGPDAAWRASAAARGGPAARALLASPLPAARAVGAPVRGASTRGASTRGPWTRVAQARVAQARVAGRGAELVARLGGARARGALAASALAAGFLAACSAVPELPAERGRGVIAFDRSAPAGAEQFERPTWHRGDRFAFRHGGATRLEYVVAQQDDDGYVVTSSSGQQLRFTADLGEAGEQRQGDPASQPVRDPADQVLHWPLWVGKRWSCQFAWKTPGQPAVPLRADYHCDAAEIISVPAGALRCLRIWRQVAIDAEGDYGRRTSLLWYSPEAGLIVRRLDNGMLLELEELHREPASGAGGAASPVGG
jgi:hypothetical protein